MKIGDKVRITKEGSILQGKVGNIVVVFKPSIFVVEIFSCPCAGTILKRKEDHQHSFLRSELVQVTKQFIKII